MTHEARMAVKALDLGDLNLYDQVRLMVWCFNYSHNRVYNSLKKIRKVHGSAVGRFIMDEGAKHTSRLFGSRRTESEFGVVYRQAVFSAKAVKHLYYVDHTMFCADYGNSLVRLDDFAQLLDEIEYEAVLELGAELGKRSIGFIFMKMEELLARKRQGREQIRQMSDFHPDYGEPMSEEDRKKLGETLDEIRTVQDKRGEEA